MKEQAAEFPLCLATKPARMVFTRRSIVISPEQLPCYGIAWPDLARPPLCSKTRFAFRVTFTAMAGLVARWTCVPCAVEAERHRSTAKDHPSMHPIVGIPACARLVNEPAPPRHAGALRRRGTGRRGGGADHDPADGRSIARRARPPRRSAAAWQPEQRASLALRRRRQPDARSPRPGARRHHAAADPRGDRARHAAAGDLSRHPGAERGPRRHAAPEGARGSRTDGSSPRPRHDRGEVCPAPSGVPVGRSSHASSAARRSW